MNNRIRLLALIMVLLVIITGCNSNKSDYEKYDKLKGGIKYKTYTKLSKSIIPLSVSTYNKNAADKTKVKIKENDLRLMLCLAWILSDKADFSMAESNIILSSDDSEARLLAYDLLSIAMYEKGWNVLATDMGEKGTSSKAIDKDDKNKSLAAWMIIGCYGVYSYKFDLAEAAFDRFGSQTGIKWPYSVVDALGDIKSGRIQTGIKKMKGLSEDVSVPEDIRVELKKSIKSIEEKTGSIGLGTFWPRLIASSIYDESKKVGDSGYKKLMELIEDIKDKFKQIPEV